MVLREDGDGVLCIGQPAHAWVSGQLLIDTASGFVLASASSKSSKRGTPSNEAGRSLRPRIERLISPHSSKPSSSW